MRNLSYENEFYSQVHSNANHTHFHMKDFALGLGLKQRQKATRKWPISCAWCISPETSKLETTCSLIKTAVVIKINDRQCFLVRTFILKKKKGLITHTRKQGTYL